MCSYNAETYGYGLFGPGSAEQHGAIPSCANKYLMTDLARGAWGFDGYITSDCGAVGGVQNDHGYTKNASETAMATLGAGMDTDCGNYLHRDTMQPLLADSTVAPLADTALTRLFLIQMRLGFFDARNAVPWGNYGAEVVDTPAHRRLSKEAADQSLVLLKNEEAALPWDAKVVTANGRTVAVVGRNAMATRNMLGNCEGLSSSIVSLAPLLPWRLPQDPLIRHHRTALDASFMHASPCARLRHMIPRSGVAFPRVAFPPSQILVSPHS